MIVDTKFKKRNLKLYGDFKDYNVICHKCNKNIIINEREKLFPSKSKYYCNRSCANSRQQNVDVNGNRSSSLKKYYPPFEKICCGCNNIITFTTHKHLVRSLNKNSLCKSCLVKNRISSEFFKNMGSIGGKLSVAIQSNTRRSKNEMAFAGLCKLLYSNVLTNEPIFNGWDADIILPDLKVAILWNGKWHYEKLTEKHSVKQVQNRDNIKLDEITKMGYTPYVIKDMGKYDPGFVKNEFEKFVNFINNNYIVIYKYFDNLQRQATGC